MSREIVEIVRRAHAALGNAAAEEAVFKLIEADLLDRRPSALCSGRWGGLHLCSPLLLAPNFDKRKAKSTNYLFIQESRRTRFESAMLEVVRVATAK
jgi:hypothetical protein